MQHHQKPRCWCQAKMGRALDVLVSRARYLDELGFDGIGTIYRDLRVGRTVGDVVRKVLHGALQLLILVRIYLQVKPGQLTESEALDNGEVVLIASPHRVLHSPDLEIKAQQLVKCCST